MAVVAAHLAVGRVQVGRVGEGWREGVIVRGGVARRGEQRLGIRLGRRWRGVVVLVLACGRSAAVAEGLSLSQLVAEGRHPLLFLQTQEESNVKAAMLANVDAFISNEFFHLTSKKCCQTHTDFLLSIMTHNRSGPPHQY